MANWASHDRRWESYEEYDFSNGVDDYYNDENKMELKPWWKSRTLWLAIAQAVAGVLVMLFNDNPELASVGVGAVLKSFLDVYLRVATSKPVV